MKAQQTVFDFLKDTMGHSTLLAISGELMPFANDSFDNARFLSQLLFWVDDREEWTPIPFKEWKTIAKLSRYAVEKARYYFYDLGVLEYKVKKDAQGNPTAHYKLDFKVLMTELKKFFKGAKTVILSSYAELLKTKREQNQKQMSTKTYTPYKEKLESKNIGRQSEQDRRQELKDKYEPLYL